MFVNLSPKPTRWTLAALTGITVFPLVAPLHALPTKTNFEDSPVATSTSYPDADGPNDCLATTLCAIKDRVRWRTPAWNPEFCTKIAHAVFDSSKRYELSPALILAVMMNESDLNENAQRITTKNSSVYAIDGGLMGIRCLPDRHNRCTNGHVRGLPWKSVMDPVTNIELGARQLAHYKNGGGVMAITIRIKDRTGQLRTKQKNVSCTHRNHAYWAHYNHGPRYIDHGPARHYPHRIAVLYYALARAMNADTSEVTETRLTVRDPNQRERTADRPIGFRYRKLCQSIREAGTACTDESKTAYLTNPATLSSY